MRVLSWINFQNYLNGYTTKQDCERASFHITEETFLKREWIGVDIAKTGSGHTILTQEDDFYEATAAEKFCSGWDLVFGKK